MRTSASCPFIEAHWSFSLVNRVAVAFVWLVLPICAVHFRDEKCCCGRSAEGEPGQWQRDNEWETCGGCWEGDTGRPGHRHKHGGLCGKGLERLWPSGLELSSNGISGWALLTSPFKSALRRAMQVGGWMAACACPNEKQNPSTVARR